MPRVLVSLLLSGVLSACSGGASTPPSSSAGPAAARSDTDVKRLQLVYERPVVGARVHAAVDGLAPGRAAELVWKTVTGGWVIEDYYHFRGKKYADAERSLGRFPVGPDGRLDAAFAIPEDYGGVHDVLVRVDGKTVAQNGLEVTQSFEMTPRAGPVGTPIELRVEGIGWRTMESTWVVNWDNHEVGWVSAAGTHGSATARFRAAGAPGDHVVKVYTGYQGQSYLNFEQAPTAYLPRPQFTFRTTEARALRPPAYAEPYPQQPVPDAEVRLDNAAVTLTPTQGPVQTSARLAGEGFPAGAGLKLVWQSFAGSRVSGDGFAANERELGRVPVGADGRLDVPVTIPDDLGGRHALVLMDGANVLARTHFVIETSIVDMTPTSGPVGTPVRLHLKGVGWTEYDNIYVATYDNAYMGYACGFNSQGDVVINFVASGAPGAHLIDLYPGIYQGPAGAGEQLLYRTPQLSYAEDHPGNRIPALRFTFDVTPSRADSPAPGAPLDSARRTR